MPSNFFKSENIKKDSPDFSVMKIDFQTFSKDFKNRRITGRCISSKGRMDISEQPGYSFINISKKDVLGKKFGENFTCKYTRINLSFKKRDMGKKSKNSWFIFMMLLRLNFILICKKTYIL